MHVCLKFTANMYFLNGTFTIRFLNSFSQPNDMNKEVNFFIFYKNFCKQSDLNDCQFSVELSGRYDVRITA